MLAITLTADPLRMKFQSWGAVTVIDLRGLAVRPHSNIDDKHGSLYERFRVYWFAAFGRCPKDHVRAVVTSVRDRLVEFSSA
jgi:hypothetical protein